MSILHIDLEKEEIRSIADRGEKGYLLLHELIEGRKDCIAFTSITKDDLALRGASSSCYAFFSPLRGKIQYGYSNSSFPFVLYSFGYTALLISGRASCLSYISIRGNAIEMKRCEDLRHSSQEEFKKAVREKDSDIVLSTGRAADDMIRISALYEDGREIGRGGFGYAFSALNLKGICFQSYLPKRKEDEEGRRYLKEIEKSGFAGCLKRESDTAWIVNVERHGALPIDNFSRRHDARAVFLDGSYLKGRYGAYSISCTDCPVSCRRIMQDGTAVPELDEMIALGAMQDIFSSDKVLLLRSAVFDAGLETVEAGAMLSMTGLTFEEKIKKVKNYKGEDYGSYKVGGLSPLFDLRGSGEAALFMMLGDSFVPYYSLYSPSRIRDERSSAILALFERVYRYALSSRGLPVKGAYAAYVSPMPRICYHSPFLLRMFLEHVSFFSIDRKILIREGLEIMNMIGEDENQIPGHFIYTSSSGSDESTVNPTRLMWYYKREKRRLELKYLDRPAKRKAEKG